MSGLDPVGPLLVRLRRFERRVIGRLLRWLESTENLLHVSLLIFAPLAIGLVTFVTNAVALLPFLLFPPLASGAYTLFSHPRSQYASPRRFVGGMTVGAICGWLAVTLVVPFWDPATTETAVVHPWAAAFAIFLTGVVTWALEIEEPQAFSTALLVLVSGITQIIYVVSIFLSSLLVAGVFVLWRRNVYEQRAEYLYQTIHEDDVLVPMRGEIERCVGSFGAQIGAASEGGTVVLLDVLDPETVGEQAQQRPDGGTRVDTEAITQTDEMPDPVRETTERLQSHAAALERRFDVSCELVIATGDPDNHRIVAQTARKMGCDIVVTPYETEDNKLSMFIRKLFSTRLDVIVIRTQSDRDVWNRILVPVRSAGEVAHAMLDFAGRLVGEHGHAAVCHCIDSEDQRRQAEQMLANLAETFDRTFETRVAHTSIEEFLAQNTENYDLTIVGSSTDRTVASRFLNPPTFEQLDDIDCDIAIVHRG